MTEELLDRKERLRRISMALQGTTELAEVGVTHHLDVGVLSEQAVIGHGL